MLFTERLFLHTRYLSKIKYLNDILRRMPMKILEILNSKIYPELQNLSVGEQKQYLFKCKKMANRDVRLWLGLIILLFVLIYLKEALSNVIQPENSFIYGFLWAILVGLFSGLYARPIMRKHLGSLLSKNNQLVEIIKQNK